VISAFTGGIRNGGTISSSNGGDIYVGGRATGSGTSVTLSTFSGGISNSGTISTPLSGIYVGGTAANHGAVTLASFVGGISNAGAISAVGSGIFVGGSAASGASLTLSTFAGGISNSGTISAAYGILVAGYSKNSGVTTISVFSGGITNSGTIATSKTGLAVRNVATFMGGISNSGVISEAVSNASGIALTVYDVSTFSGGIVNSGTVSSNRYGIQSENVSTFLGGITNSGVISLNSTRVGIGVYNISTLSGGIVNSGTISGGLFPTVVENVSSFTGGVTNSGLIDGWVPGIGIDVVGAGTFAGGILNSGTIASAKSGITVANVSAFSGGITNSGSIGVGSGQIANPQPGTGLYVKNVSTFTGTVLNSGTISPSGAGVLLQNISTFNGGITNSGLISLGYRGLGIDVESPSVLTGSIVNSGTIVGAPTIGIVILGFGETLTPAIGLQLSGAGTLSGGVTNSGLIAVAGDGIFVENSGTIVGSVLNSGTITAGAASGTPHTGIAVSGVSAISGGITNTGMITAGVGIAVSNSGPVSVFDSGTIVSTGVTSSGTTSNGGITIPGSIVFPRANIVPGTVSTFSGGITNLGSVTISGAITNAGIVTGSGGITNLGSVTIGGAITNAGIITSSGGITVVGVPTFNGGVAVDLSQNSPGNKFTLGPGYSISGAVLGSGSDTFQLGGSGSGTFDVSTIGTNQQYQGFTTFNVVSGGWTLSGTFGQTQSWNVLGGTLAGNAALGSVNVASGGVLAPGLPGTPGGRLTVSGNLAFASGAIYLVQINPTTASYTSVAGSAALNGNVLAAFAAGNYLMKQYTILTSSGLNGSKFAGLGTTNLPAGFDASLSYSATDAFLNLTAALGRPASGSSLGGNQQNIANSLNNFFNGGGALTPNFVTIFGMTGGNLTTALSQLSGQARTAGEQGSFKMMSNFLGLAVDPSVAGRGGDAAGGGAIGFAPEEDPSTPAGIPIELTPVINPAQPPSFDQRWTAWGSGFGGYNKTNGDPSAGTSTVTTSVYGFAGGMDYHATPDLMVGFALAGSGSNWALAQNLGSGRSDSLQTGVYGTAHAGPAYLSASLAFTNHWIMTNRTAALGDQLTAAFDAQSYGARLEAGYRLAPSPLIGVTPYAAAQTQVFRTPGYSETDLTGGGFGLSYNAMTATDTRSEVGARFDDLTTVNGMPLILRARAAWAHDWVSTPALTATFQTLPGANFVVNGTAIPANSALATLSAELRLTTAWSFGAQFDGEVASGSQTYAGTGTLRYTW
jgi:outer membrane autotransporter protein